MSKFLQRAFSQNGIATVAVLAALLVSTEAGATNGYFTHGVGVKNKAMAGAGSATPDEAAVTAINPAAAVVVGDRLEVGLSIFSPTRKYKTSDSFSNGEGGAFTVGPNSLRSGNESFPIPYLGKVWQRGENAAVAMNFYGRGGMNTEFSGGSATFDPDGPGPASATTSAGTFGGGTAGVDLSQAFIDLTYARRTGSVSWGVSMVLAVQSFEAKGLANFAGLTETFARSGGAELPKNLTNNGHEFSFGYGFKAGVIWDLHERWNLAAAYQSKTIMQDFDRYSDLFAEGGGFDVPANARVGVSWVATDRLTLHFDVERTWFSEVGSVGNPIDGIQDCPTAGSGGNDLEACLGGSHGAGFGWDDVTVYKVGAQWRLPATPRWTWRAGFSHADQPINDSETLFNILAPAVVEQHVTFGGSRTLDSGREFSFAVMYAPENSARGPNAFDPTQTIELEMHQFELEFALRF